MPSSKEQRKDYNRGRVHRSSEKISVAILTKTRITARVKKGELHLWQYSTTEAIHKNS